MVCMMARAMAPCQPAKGMVINMAISLQLTALAQVRVLVSVICFCFQTV